MVFIGFPHPLQALYLATLGGAAALNLAEHLGSFEEGKRFDALLLRRSCQGKPPLWPTGVESKEDLLLKIITLGDDRHFLNFEKVFACFCLHVRNFQVVVFRISLG